MLFAVIVTTLAFGLPIPLLLWLDRQSTRGADVPPSDG